MKQPYNTTVYNTALYLRLSRDDELQGESGSIQTQGGNGNSKDGNIRAGLKDGSKEVLLAQDGKITENAYNTVKYEFNEGVVSVYLNDTLIETTDSGYSIQDIISAGTDGTALGYIGKSLYSPDPAYKGTLKSFKLSATEKDHSDEAKVAEAKEALTLPYNTTNQAVYGNITLPTEAGDGVAEIGRAHV